MGSGGGAILGFAACFPGTGFAGAVRDPHPGGRNEPHETTQATGPQAPACLRRDGALRKAREMDLG